MFTIVPRSITRDGADIFVGCFEHVAPRQPLALLLCRGGETRKIADVYLRNVIDGGDGPPITWWAGQIDQLEPNARYELYLGGGADNPLASAWIETLPDSLPSSPAGTAGFRPFTVWLSSCFSARRSPAGLEEAIARAYGDARRRPHVKFLVGDQVYLDELFMLIYSALTDKALRTRFNAQYTRSWTHPAFSTLLAAGATYFLPDDHELWNNYPHSPFGIPLRGSGFWKTWRRLAYDERCLAIQPPATGPVFGIGQELSFFVADMRSQAVSNLSRFMGPQEMSALATWLDELRCPGVLVLQQPIITGRGGPRDRKLPDYAQYWTDLLPALRRCRQDLVVMAGDSHAGQVATTTLRSNGGTPGDPPPRLIQVVSSPLSLVSPLAAGRPSRWPLQLPGVENIPATDVDYEMSVPTYRTGPALRTEEHGMTVSFWRQSESLLGMRVQTYLARAAVRAPAPVWEGTLRLRRS